MNYLEASLEPICGISLDWSSDCNMACKYCYIEKDKACMEAFNAKIRQALEDGTFVNNIKKLWENETLRQQIESLSLWGAEPTINGQYFESTITALLDYFTHVNDFMFSTNALMGSKWILDKFVLPLYNYCESHQRKVRFSLQLSLDGPPEFNDSSRHKGATKNTLNTIKTLVTILPPTAQYFSLRLTTKPTLDISYMRLMNERGIECFNWYYQFFDQVQQEALELNGDRSYVELQLNQIPTLVDPGFHTSEDGKNLAKWIHYLRYVDRTKLPTYDGMSLFFQPLTGLATYFQLSNNPLAHGYDAFSCSASKNNITVDYEGNLYTCNRLARNHAMSEELMQKHAVKVNSNYHTSDKAWIKKTWGSQAFHLNLKSRREIFDGLVLALAGAGQIDKKYFTDAEARTLLFYATVGLTCHIGWEEDLTQNPFLMSASIIRMLGNGALDELLELTMIQIKRGEEQAWKTVL